LQYNPLGNLEPYEVGLSYVWSNETLSFVKKIRKNTRKYYCVEGKKGVGKTTLLQSLLFQLEDSAYISFKKGDRVNLSSIKEQILIIDRVYNLNIFQRAKLWRCKKTIVYSAHYDTYGVEQLNIRMKTKIKLGPKKPKEIKEIISKKLFLANLKLNDFECVLSDKNIQIISKKHCGNPRAIINELYFKI